MSDDIPLHKLPPLKREALEDLGRGPIKGAWSLGWEGQRGKYNTHTIHWIAAVGWGDLNKDKTELTITRAGRKALAGLGQEEMF